LKKSTEVPVKNPTLSQTQLKTVLTFVLVCFLLTSLHSFCQSIPTGRTKTPSDNIFHALNSQACTGSLGDPIVNFTFGAGAGGGTSFGAALPATVTNMQYVSNTCPNDGYYTITNYTSACFSNSWHTVTDHTGDANGYFMLINASYTPSDFYLQQVDGLCSGTTYEFSAWLVNVMRIPGILPNITFSIEKTDGTVLQSYKSGDISSSTSPTWKQYGMFFTTPIGITSVVIRLRNNAPGGNGNDIGLDDITFRPAGPSTRISASVAGDSLNMCNTPIPLTAVIESCYLTEEYQWQVSANNAAWANIPGANSISYTVPVQPPGKYKYRLLVSASGNISITTCRVSSNVTTVVVVPPAVVNPVSATICQGQSYTLPSGKKLNAAGDFLDTVRYPFGCDSLVTQLQLTVQAPVFFNKDTSICKGQTYTLPGGIVVSTPGIYKDTLTYAVTGCDSLVRTINLTIKPVTVSDSFVVICNGDKLTLPWGPAVSSAGVYSDTLLYVAGCDSVIQNVHLHVTVASSQSMESFICPNQSYTLPSGAVVRTPGNYVDTLRTPIGCDSIITYLKLSPAPPPTIEVTKSNDVNCTLGISKLIASGGAKYVWVPAESLNNSYIPNPIASPSTTTTYKVMVATNEGCIGQDTITVFVSPDLAKNGIEIPNAFSPNGDGRNDCFSVRFLGHISNLKLSVYDRWGNRVFYTTNPSQCWDGSYKGKQLQSDVFVYQLSATTMCGDVVKQGTLTLIR
jgi:gliding motility-associated-like protein